MHQQASTTSKQIAQIFHYAVASGKISKDILILIIDQAHQFRVSLLNFNGNEQQIRQQAASFVNYLREQGALSLDEDDKEDLWEFIQSAAEAAGMTTIAIDISSLA